MTTDGRRRATFLRAAVPTVPPALVVLLVPLVLAGCTSAVSGRPGSANGATVPEGPATSVTVPTVGSVTTPPGSAAHPPGDSASGSTGPPSSALGSSPASPPVPPRSRTPPGGSGPGASAATTSAPPASSPPPTGLPPGQVAGSAGAGDPYYPDAGNGGYQVDKYTIVLSYDPSSNDLDATATIAATVTAARTLGRFDLDLQPDLTVSSVTVNRQPASFDHQGSELVITPAIGIAPTGDMTVVVAYSGRPGMINEGASNLGAGGWYRTADGGALAAGEPFSASAWYPVNEHPSDPAAFSVTATVPDGWQAISNGTKFDGALPPPPKGMHTVRFDENRAIASYLTTILIDRLTFTTGTFDGKPILNAFTTDGADDKQLARQTSQVLAVLSRHFGPFPFASYGGIYTGENLQFALETATRPVYASWVSLDTVVHETAHQWYGDDVMIERWSDVCLNECFASYAPWLYHADVDGTDLDKLWKQQMAQVAGEPSFWRIPLVDMGAGNEFTSVYDRGPLALHALRHEMGEKAFAELLKGWITTYGGRNASFDDLEAYASKLAGKDLKPFMDAWFRGTVVPAQPYRTPPGLG